LSLRRKIIEAAISALLLNNPLIASSVVVALDSVTIIIIAVD